MAVCKNCSGCRDSLDAKCIMYNGPNIENFDITIPVDLETIIKNLGDTFIENNCEFCLPEGDTDGQIVNWFSSTNTWNILIPCLSNTLFVSTCGDDTTALIGNPMRPYQTIKGAVTAATSNASQLIYVFPGTYSESAINKTNAGTEKVGISYYFSPNTIVSGGGSPVWNSSATAGNITIRGAGVFTSAASNVITAATTAVVYDIECKSIDNTGGSGSTISFSIGTLYLKCTSVTATGGNCFDIRTGATTGYVTCDLIDNSSSALQASAVHFKDITASGAKWTFDVGLTKSNANSSGLFQAVCLDTGNTGLPIVYYNGNVEFSPSSSGTYNGGIGCNTGTLIFTGDIKNTTSFGWGAVSVGGKLVLKDARIRVTGATSAAIFLVQPFGVTAGLCIAENCEFVSDSANPGYATCLFSSATNTGAYTLQMTACKIKNEDTSGTSACVSLNNAANVIIMDSCNLYTASATGTPFHTTVAANTRLTNCWANKVNGGIGVFTDLVQAMNVDADLLFYVY